MNKFKYGDRVHIKPLNLDGKVLGWTLKIINGVECTCKYGVETLINNIPHIAGDVDEDDLELIEYAKGKYFCLNCATLFSYEKEDVEVSTYPEGYKTICKRYSIRCPRCRNKITLKEERFYVENMDKAMDEILSTV